MSRFLGLVLLLSWSVLAQANILVLNDGVAISADDISQALRIYRGEHPPQSLDDAVSRVDGYRPSGDYILLRRYQPQWLRLQMRNESESERVVILDLRHALLSEVNMRLREGDGQRDSLTGLLHAHANRDVNVNTFQYIIRVPAKSDAQVDMSIVSPSSPILSPRLFDVREAGRDVLQTSYFFGFIIGQIFAVGFFLVCYMVLMQRSSEIIYLLLFCFMGIMAVLFHSGVLAYNFPSIFAKHAHWAHVFIQASSLALLCKLMQVFYNTARKHYWVHQMLSISFFACLLIIAALPILDTKLITQLFFWVQLCFYVGALWFCLFCLLNGRRGVPLLISLGMVVYVGILLARLLASLNIIPIMPIMRFTYELALGCMMDMLCVAVVGAMLKNQRDSIRASEKIMRIESEMQARSDVVAKITHDIKSPLTAILGAEQLLRDQRPDLSAEDQASYLSIIRTSGHMVLSMVDDVLLHAEVKRGHLQLIRERIEIRKWLADIDGSVRAMGINSLVVLQCHTAADVPSVVVGDPRRLTQIITNLLVNAFKFTDEGFVNLSVTLKRLEASRCQLLFTVTDSGIGMSPEFIKRAFDSYSREASSAVAGKIGFGLGLAICQQLVNELEGSIEVDSVQGEGTVFRVTLPFTLPSV